MCLAQGPQRSDAGEARTRGPSVSSQALYHWATALPHEKYVQLNQLNAFSSAQVPKKRVWSGNTTITHCRLTQSTVGKRHRTLTITRHQEDKSLADPDGGQGVWTPPPPTPGKLQKLGLLARLIRIPSKSQSYQASISWRAIICPPVKRHWNGISLAANNAPRFYWYFDLLPTLT